MMQATTQELRTHSTALIERVLRGEEVIITRRGKPCAKLVPLETPAERGAETHQLFGIWRDYDAVQDVDNYVRTVRRGRAHGD